MTMMRIVLICLVSIAPCLSDPTELTTEPTTPSPPPRPYAFGYAAGRFPGNIDRTHSEVSDGSGTVRGSYSYVDPRLQIRTVEYTADRSGFHAHLDRTPPPLPSDTPVVAAAKRNHLRQYENIAASQQYAPSPVVPYDTVAVEKAKERHFALYERIAAEHAHIAAQLAEREKEEGGANDVE